MKTAKTGAEMTPLEKARAARAANKANGVTATPAARSSLPAFEVPADFTPHFLEVVVRTEKDGLFATGIKATRFKGRYDPNAEDKKKFDLGAYDTTTLMGIMARLSAVTFKPTNDNKYPKDPEKRNALKGSFRLPASTSFKIVMRIGKKSADSSLTVSIKQIKQGIKKNGVMKAVTLANTDPVFRLIRRATRFLPAAFANVQQPPARRRAKKTEESDE
jgi:hypothetical protein